MQVSLVIQLELGIEKTQKVQYILVLQMQMRHLQVIILFIQHGWISINICEFMMIDLLGGTYKLIKIVDELILEKVEHMFEYHHQGIIEHDIIGLLLDKKIDIYVNWPLFSIMNKK